MGSMHLGIFIRVVPYLVIDNYYSWDCITTDLELKPSETEIQPHTQTTHSSFFSQLRKKAVKKAARGGLGRGY